VFQQRLKRRLVRTSSLFALFGLALLMLSLSSALLLILDVVLGADIAAWIAGAMLAWFMLLWFAVPLWCRFHGGDGAEPESTDPI
jgi:hypothetical protein